MRHLFTSASSLVRDNKEVSKGERVESVGLISSIMLICAVALSLGSGVLAAYGLCVGMFRVFRMHALQVAAARVPQSQSTTLGAARN